MKRLLLLLLLLMMMMIYGDDGDDGDDGDGDSDDDDPTTIIMTKMKFTISIKVMIKFEGSSIIIDEHSYHELHLHHLLNWLFRCANNSRFPLTVRMTLPQAQFLR